MPDDGAGSRLGAGATDTVIHYLTTSQGQTTVRGYLESRGRALAPILEPVLYEDLFTWTRIPRGCWVFADLERLAPEALLHADRLHTLLRGQEGVRVHNRPLGCALKEEFQPRMHALGVNRFTSYPATSFPASIRYPVFLRDQKKHDGPATPLLPDADSLARAMGRLLMRGTDLSRYAVVEFLNTAGPDGLRRFYSGFLIGGRIVIRYILVSRGWVQKTWESLTPEVVAEEAAYIREKPHEAWMRSVFAHAGIEYGRLDFGITPDGCLQAWEINTNPGFVKAAETYPMELLENSRYVGDEFEAAIRALDVEGSGAPIEVPWEPRSFRDGGRVTPSRKDRGWQFVGGLLRFTGLGGVGARWAGRRAFDRSCRADPATDDWSARTKST